MKKRTHRKRRPSTISLDLIPEREGKLLNPLEIIITEERKELVYKAIGTLNKNQRTAIVLRYFKEMSIKEGAKAMGVTPNNFKSYLFRGRENLHDFLVELMKDN